MDMDADVKSTYFNHVHWSIARRYDVNKTSTSQAYMDGAKEVVSDTIMWLNHIIEGDNLSALRLGGNAGHFLGIVNLMGYAPKGNLGKERNLAKRIRGDLGRILMSLNEMSQNPQAFYEAKKERERLFEFSKEISEFFDEESGIGIGMYTSAG